jgi:uncharacterized protein (DUF58 family)
MTDWLDPQHVGTYRRLLEVARRLDGGGLLEQRTSRLPAGGTELTGYRDYTPGDDYRQVDWRFCARHDELITRQYEGETDLRVYVLLDISRSMGPIPRHSKTDETPRQPSKFDVARQIAAALSYVAVSGLRRVGISAFADVVVDDSPSVCELAQFVRIARFLENLQPSGPIASLEQAGLGWVRRYQRRGLVIVLSDFLGDPAGFERGIEVLHARGYRPVVMQVCDPADARPPALGDIEWCDAETGSTGWITVTERVWAKYRESYEGLRTAIRNHAAARALRYVRVSTAMPLDEILLAAIGAGPGLPEAKTVSC